ncbi:predicted protein [Histoplasma capsulatum G186AR]|uniref:Uncharacterized protein n=1 Tax=Ajellomyces capsulatus (strain G186AR / H82 / ATCC MYA-2454 / RMSCC 2432) TaxID=447093 RepID=C0NY72_AJECG|nr:uncharacterized protein HCBG_07866 [Histoplasma capsulatum G186AR]EEH03740.1 predicted protein [Histoplasma capsulatum G186AR]
MRRSDSRHGSNWLAEADTIDFKLLGRSRICNIQLDFRLDPDVQTKLGKGLISFHIKYTEEPPTSRPAWVECNPRNQLQIIIAWAKKKLLVVFHRFRERGHVTSSYNYYGEVTYDLMQRTGSLAELMV